MSEYPEKAFPCPANGPAELGSYSQVQHQPSPTREEEDAYYRDLFVNNPSWSSKDPNTDEKARWQKIYECLQHAAQTVGVAAQGGLRILDVGCGRGWLTNLASACGQTEGVEPVQCVIEHARTLFPKLRFHVGTVGTVLEQSDFRPFDIVICSEVIEHVPDSDKPVFIGQIQNALKPGGCVIITTPRKEVLAQLQERGLQSSQPIEEWLSEAQVRQHFTGMGFRVLANHRVLYDLKNNSYPSTSEAPSVHPQIVGLYQVWCFQAPRQGESIERLCQEPV